MASMFDAINPQNAPQAMPGTFDQASSFYQQGAGLIGQSVSPQSRDRAAARIRASVDQQRRSADRMSEANMAGRGLTNARANTGLMTQQRNRNFASANQALATGLGNMENEYSRLEQQAGQAFGQLGSQYGNTANQMNQFNLDRFARGIDATRAIGENQRDMLITYLTQANALNNPSVLAPLLGQFGIDATNFQFYQPPASPGQGEPLTSLPSNYTALNNDPNHEFIYRVGAGGQLEMARRSDLQDRGIYIWRPIGQGSGTGSSLEPSLR